MPYFSDRVIAGVPDATELYYNIQVKNNNTGFDSSGNPIGISSSTPLIFDETRSAPYINNPSDYYMSVISYQIDTASLPVFVCEPVVGGNDISKTYYWVTITDASNNINGHTQVLWAPQDLSAPLPPTPVPNNYSSYPYYYCYSFSYFIELVNKAIASIYPHRNPPFLVIDNNNQISIKGMANRFITDVNGECVGTGGLPNPNGHKLFFNTELYYLFSSLNALNHPDPVNGLNNSNFQILFPFNPSGLNIETIYTDLTAVPITSGPSYRAIVSQCEYSPLPFWNPIDSLQFVTYYLTVVQELFGTNSTFYDNTSIADQYYILTDFTPRLVNGTETQPNIIYEPLAEYKLCDLYGIQPLQQLKFNVVVKDKFGGTRQMTIESGGVASIKLLFRKKNI